MPSRRLVLRLVPVCIGAGLLASRPALAASAASISRDAWQALERLYAEQPSARTLASRAKAILMFPKITKAGLMVGGQYGEGALLQGGRTVDYYSIAAGSFGLQIGAQTFSCAMFFMNDTALKYLHDSDGWSVGSGPSVVMLDKGAAASMTSTTLTKDVYAVPFSQSGLMAEIGIEGSKISHLKPS